MNRGGWLPGKILWTMENSLPVARVLRASERRSQITDGKVEAAVWDCPRFKIGRREGGAVGPGRTQWDACFRLGNSVVTQKLETMQQEPG